MLIPVSLPNSGCSQPRSSDVGVQESGRPGCSLQGSGLSESRCMISSPAGSITRAVQTGRLGGCCEVGARCTQAPDSY